MGKPSPKLQKNYGPSFNLIQFFKAKTWYNINCITVKMYSPQVLDA